jgi:hypothetical protein
MMNDEYPFITFIIHHSSFIILKMAYTYLGIDYPPEIGVLLPGVSVALFPHLMTDNDVRLLLDEMPYLRRFWSKTDKGSGSGTGGTGSDTDDKNGNGVPDKWDFAWDALLNLDPLLRRLIAETSGLTGTVGILQQAVKSNQS